MAGVVDIGGHAFEQQYGCCHRLVALVLAQQGLDGTNAGLLCLKDIVQQQFASQFGQSLHIP